MPGFPFPGRPGGEHDEPLLDMIIARRVLPPDAPQPMHDLARMLAALAGPAEPGELAGEAAVRAAFSRAASPVGISSAARRPGRRRGPQASGSSSFPSQAGHGAGRGGGRAGQRLRGLHRRAAQPHSATGARHGGGAGPAQLRPALRSVTARRPSATHATLQPSGQPAPGPHHSAARLGSPASGNPEAELQAQLRPGRPVTRATGPSCGPGLAHSPSPQPKASGQSEPALVVPGRALHRHPDRAGGPAHPGPVRSLRDAQAADGRSARDVSGARSRSVSMPGAWNGMAREGPPPVWSPDMAARDRGFPGRALGIPRGRLRSAGIRRPWRRRIPGDRRPASAR